MFSNDVNINIRLKEKKNMINAKIVIDTVLIKLLIVSTM